MSDKKPCYEYEPPELEADKLRCECGKFLSLDDRYRLRGKIVCGECKAKSEEEEEIDDY